VTDRRRTHAVELIRTDNGACDALSRRCPRPTTTTRLWPGRSCTGH